MRTILQLYVPFPTQEEAEIVVKTLLEEKRIACGNIVKAQSLYNWEERIESEGEYIVFLKTIKRNMKSVVLRIEGLHTYEVPCIIVKKVSVNNSYYNWMKSVVG